MEKGVVLCLFALATFTLSFETCPDGCRCTIDFADCTYGSFNTLPIGFDFNITALDLSHNAFEEFPQGLKEFENLIYLNLSYNRISVLESNSALSHLKKLEKLDLTYNMFRDWKDIKLRAFYSSLKLNFLDFSHNTLGSIPRLDNSLKIRSLEILRLTNCSMKYLYNTILDGLPNLRELHVADNPITHLNTSFKSATLKFLDISRCHLKNISRDAFTNLRAMETIWLYRNRNLKTFSCDSPSLLYLDLSDCNLESVPNGYLPKVYYANFHGNHFRVIPRLSFKDFLLLEYLDLSYNAILKIERNAFRGLDKLKFIDLSLNTLSSLSSDLFYTNADLTVLNLSRNYFTKIETFAADFLEVLDLSRCEIHSVERECLLDMPKLKTLNLSRNLISSLPDYFQSDNLEALDVSDCRINAINNRTFESMGSLRNVNLRGNRLTTAYPECFLQVTSLDINDNPWRCDCARLKDMYFWLTKTGKSAEDLYCQSPEAVEGMPWLAACQSEWSPELNDKDTVWWYTTGLILTIFVILFLIFSMRRVYLLKEKRIREAYEARRAEERETLQRMRQMQLEAREEASRNAPDPRESQRPPSYNEALLLPRLDASHPSLSGSLHSLGSKQSLHASNPDVTKKGRPRRKRRRRKSDSSEGQRASRTAVDSDTTDHEQPLPRTTLESDF